jgi:transcriptional regulator GlxA family with amidase domain
MLPKIQKVLDYISSNLDQDLTLNQIAESVSLSRSRLHYLFRTQLGMPTIQYIKLRRLERARDLLRTTSLTVKEVRVRVGLHDRSHFARQFKKTYGVTPYQYRRSTAEGLPKTTTANRTSEKRKIGDEK